MKGKSLIGVILAAICVTVTYLLPGSEELSHEGITALGVLGMASILWISNTLPFGVTGLLALVMLVLLGVSDMASVFVGFSNSSVIFVITVFCLTAAVMNTKLTLRLINKLLRWAGSSAEKLVLAYMAAAALLSSVMSNVPVTVLFLGLAQPVLKAVGAKPGSSRLGKCLMIGITTLAGNEAVIGSEGTLAVICELTLKLVDKPKADAILLLPFMDTESCIKAAATVIGTGCAPAVVEYMDTDMVEFSGNVTGNPVFPVEMDGERVAATLMAVLEGEDDDLVMEQMEAIAELAEEMECLDILVGDTTTMKRDMWAAHDAFHTSMESGAKNSFEYNITVPAENIAEMVEWVKAHAGEKGMKAMAYAHVGTGGMHIHVASDAGRDEFKAALTELSAAVYEKCAALGGDIRGEYGIGYAKTAYLGENARGEFAAVKAKLDPKGILNPGKVAD